MGAAVMDGAAGEFQVFCAGLELFGIAGLVLYVAALGRDSVFLVISC